MELIRITNSQDPLLAQIPALYESAFPPEARFPTDRYLRLIDQLPQMAFHVIATNGICQGMAVWWDLGSFCFFEYLAMLPAYRCQGLGTEVLQTLLSRFDKPILGEVEPPVTEIQKRRMDLYRRNGFHMVTDPAILNSYHPDNPLWLITSQPLEDVDGCQLTIISDVYEVVGINM